MGNENEYGTGVLCPFQRDGKGDFVNGSGLALLKSDVKELVGIVGPTRTQPGELPWRTDIGSRVLAMRHRGMHGEMVRATAEQNIVPTVRKYEKRVTPGATSVEQQPENGALLVRFTYMPNATVNGAGNDSVDFEVTE